MFVYQSPFLFILDFFYIFGQKLTFSVIYVYDIFGYFCTTIISGRICNI